MIKKIINIVGMVVLFVAQIVIVNHYLNVRDSIFVNSEQTFADVYTWDKQTEQLLRDYASESNADAKARLLLSIAEAATTASYLNQTFAPRIVNQPDSVIVKPYQELTEAAHRSILYGDELETDYYISFFEKKEVYNTYFSAVNEFSVNSDEAIEAEAKKFRAGIVTLRIAKAEEYKPKQADFLDEQFTKLGLDKYYLN